MDILLEDVVPLERRLFGDGTRRLVRQYGVHREMSLRLTSFLGLALIALLGGCATRPVNPPSTQADPSIGYRMETRGAHSNENSRDTIFVLAFSGGGTRAAAFSYGVLEFLRQTEFADTKGRSTRLLKHVDLITGVSGGSFTALAYGLYGEKLFDDYETRFLKRDVQGEILARTLNPLNWTKLWSKGWGRSELAAQLYDEILFNGATFADLNRGDGPMIMASATDLSSGARFVFNQTFFDIICSDLSAVPLSRAAAASSAVPVVLSSVTLNNYGGTCNLHMPAWALPFIDSKDPPRPAARAVRSLNLSMEYADGANRPFLHLVDGGVADNLGMRGVLDVLEMFQALHSIGRATPLDGVHRIVVFVVNSKSAPPTTWDKSEDPPGTIGTMLKAAGTPIDQNSFELVEQLKDIAARWRTMRRIRDSAAMASNADPLVAEALQVPDAEIYAIDVSFAALTDKAEFEYLNAQPTSFVLPPEAVDRLRAAAGKIILTSPEFSRLLKDLDAHVVADTKRDGSVPTEPPAPESRSERH
jgi:NTE family protein